MNKNIEMKRQLIRIGTEKLVNISELNKFNAFDLLYGDFHELVYVPDYYPWQHANGTWTGAMDALMNDKPWMDWMHFNAFKFDSYSYAHAFH